MTKRQTVFFLIDTQGANCVGCYQPNLGLQTPHVDRLAANGMRFSRAYTCAPVCGPARSALLTGLFPHSNGVLANNIAPQSSLPTLGQRLQSAGIATGYVGKWHLDGSDYFGDGRCPPGWDPGIWFDGRNYLESLSKEERRLSRRILDPSEVMAHCITSEFTHAHRIADRAIEFIRRHHDEDFFLLVSIDEPHQPAICPEPYVGAFEDYLFPVPNADDRLADKPRGQREWADHTAPLWASHLVRTDDRTWLRHPRHFSCNSYSDSQVGRVLSEIDRLTPDALVTYTSDHGDMFGSHRLHGKGPCMYEEIVHIPLIVRCPHYTPAGTVSDGLVSHIDLLPTFLDYYDLKVPDLLQGKSVLSQFRDPGRQVRNEVFIEFNRFELDHDGFGAFAPIRCVFDGRHKLAINLLDTDELYDLQGDPHELHNLIASPGHAAIRARLHQAILAEINRTRDPLRGPHWIRRPWQHSDNVSTWGGPTRPRPFDDAWFPKPLLYDTGEVIDKYQYEKY